MNKLLLTASVASLAIAPLAANAGDAGKAYFGAHGEYLFSSSLDNESAVAPGFAAIDVDADQGYGFGLAFGYNITDDFRAELEGNYRSSDIKVTGNFLGFPIKETATLETLTASANAYYDFNNTTAFVPYVGAGIGATTDTDATDTAFSYQLMTGVAYKLDEASKINVGYRYFSMPDYEYDTHSVEVGYRYSF